MNVSCDKKILENALSKVKNALPSPKNKDTYAKLSKALFSAEDGKLTITATNVDVSITHSISANVNVKAPGAKTAPAEEMLSLIKTLPDKEITLRVKDDTLYLPGASVKCGNTDDFPRVPDSQTTFFSSVKFSTLRRMIEQVEFAANTKDKSFRPILACIFLRLYDQNIETVATDTYRLSRAIGRLNEAVSEPTSVMIPVNSMLRICKAFDDDDIVKIGVKRTHDHVVLETNDTSVVMLTVGGKYLDYERSIPQNVLTYAQVNTKELLKACKRASLFCDTKRDVSSAILLISPDKQIMSVCSGDSDDGKTETILECTIEGDRQEIEANTRYLVDALNAIESDDTRVEVGEVLGKKIIVLKPEKKLDVSVLHVIAPIEKAQKVDTAIN